MSKKIFLTGGAGYIGSHTAVVLLNAGYEVVIYDNLSNAKYEVINRIGKITGKRPRFIKGDIKDADTLEKAIAGCDAVIHFAGLKAVGESVEKPLAYYDNNVCGALSLFKVMQKKNIKKIVFSSSATVYGAPQALPITEDHPLTPVNPYGRTKYMIEEILKDLYNSDKSWHIAILRYFNPVGAHESGFIGEDPQGIPNNLMPYISQVAIGKREHLRIFGNDYDTPDGTGIRDYIHIMDLAKGHLKALEKLEEIGCEVYNLGTGRGYSVLEVVKAFEKASGRKIPYKFTDRRPGDVPVCYADPSKAQKELGWKAEYDIDKMCQDTWNWQSKNPNGYEGEEV